MSDRSRSASPSREEPKQKKQKTGGFKWKDQKPREYEASETRNSGRLDRGYRNRSPRRDSYRDRDDRKGEREPRRDRDTDRRDDTGRGDSYRAGPRQDRDGDRSRKNDVSQADHKDGDFTQPQPPSAPKDPTAPSKPSKPKKTKAPVSNEPMIIVNINDRLGTKAAIPCLASDSIKAFKAIVAAHIGRQPHEIMLKRQGERPFKDQLSLQDYGVSNGVQLDLELDTGD